MTQSSVLLKSQQEVFPHPAEEDGAHKHLHRTRAPGMCQAATRTRTWHNIAPCNNNVQLPSSSSPPASPASPPDRVVQWCQASVLVSQMWTLFLRRCSSGFFAWRGKVCYGRLLASVAGVSPSLCAGMSWFWELTDAVRTQRLEWMLLRSLPADTLLLTSSSHLQRHELRARVCARISGTYWWSVEVQ